MTENNGLMELVNDCAPGQKPEKPSDYVFPDLLKKLGFKGVLDKVGLKYKLKKVAEGGYIEVTPKKIQAFLDRKAEAYNKEHPQKKKEEVEHSIDFLNSFMRIYGQHAPMNYQRNQQLMTQRMTATDNALRQADMENAIRMRGSHFDSVVYDEVSQWPFPPLQAMPSTSYPKVETFEAKTNDYSDMAKGKIGKFVWEEMRVEDTAHVPPMGVLKTLEAEQEKKVFDYYTVAEVKGVRDPLLLGRINGSDVRWFLAQWLDDVCLDDVI